MVKSDDAKFDGESLSAIIAHEIAGAARSEGDEQSARREENLEYLRGVMKDYLPRPNGSKVTSRILNDTVAWMLPGIMRQFTASDRMAIFEPEEPGDDEYAEQATDYANFVFWKDNDGYRNLYDATYDALAVSGDGIVKHWWDETPVTEVFSQSGMTLEQLAELADDPEVEILTQEKGEPQQGERLDEMSGQMVPVEIETFNVKLERTKRTGTARVVTIAPEDFLIDSEAIAMEDFRFAAHRDRGKTRSALIEMGFDRDKVENLPADSLYSRSAESDARRASLSGSAGSRQKETELVDLYECYLKLDVDGDGIAETIRAYYAGFGTSGTVLEWEVWEDELPFSKIPCYPRAHEFISENVADRVKDLQRLETVIWRAYNDNLLASALPQREVEEGSVLNPDVLVSPKFGALIWKKRGSAPIVPHEVPFVGEKLIPAMEMIARMREARTGVSKTMMALDPEALQNQTATASQNARDASYSQIELIARNMAEGWRRVFRALLKIIVKHQDRPRWIRLRDQFVEMDPKSWNASMDCSINVGLGTGSRDRDMAMLSMIGQAQEKFAIQLANAGFKAKAVEMLPKIVETMHDLTESAGIRSPERYWPEFDEGEIEQMAQAASQPQPDPRVQIEQQKLETEVAKSQAQIALDRQKAEAQVMNDREKAAADLELQREKMMMEAAIKREQMAGEFALKREQLGAELMLKKELAEQEMAIKREAGFYKADTMAAAKTSTSGVHMGGNPG